jgi:hypothetical protein
MEQDLHNLYVVYILYLTCSMLCVCDRWLVWADNWDSDEYSELKGKNSNYFNNLFSGGILVGCKMK